MNKYNTIRFPTLHICHNHHILAIIFICLLFAAFPINAFSYSVGINWSNTTTEYQSRSYKDGNYLVAVYKETNSPITKATMQAGSNGIHVYLTKYDDTSFSTSGTMRIIVLTSTNGWQMVETNISKGDYDGHIYFQGIMLPSYGQVYEYKVFYWPSGWSYPAFDLRYFTVKNDKIDPTATINSIYPNPAMENQTVFFSGSGMDPDGGSITAYEWRSNRDGSLSFSGSFNKSDLSAGIHTIYFKVRDDESHWSNEVSDILTISTTSTTSTSTTSSTTSTTTTRTTTTTTSTTLTTRPSTTSSTTSTTTPTTTTTTTTLPSCPDCGGDHVTINREFGPDTRYECTATDSIVFRDGAKIKQGATMIFRIKK